MTRKFSELEAKMTPEQRERARAKADEMLAAMSDKPQASAQPLTDDELKCWREDAERLALPQRDGVYRFLATIDALDTELHLLREGIDAVRELVDRCQYSDPYCWCQDFRRLFLQHPDVFYPKAAAQEKPERREL